jgi:5-methylcytosine-specific restriction endonuclease McrA
MRRHHRHGLRAVLVLGTAAALWWWLAGEPRSIAALQAAPWPALGWAELAAATAAELARAATYFTGPAWWVALSTSRARRNWRHARQVRPHIPDRMRRWVLAADRYTCVACGYRAGTACGFERADGSACGKVHGLQMEHIKAWSHAGLTSLWNLISLCPHCNRVKSNYWIYPGGRVYYRAWDDANDMAAAHAVLMAGLAARTSPARLARLAWAHWLG